MFNHSTGHRFEGGTFYNVAGDVNIQTQQSRAIELQAPGWQPPPDVTQYHHTAGLHQQLRIQDNAHTREGFYSLMGTDGRTVDSEHEFAGVVRHSRRDMAARSAPYNAASHPYRSTIPFDAHGGTSSSSSSSGLIGPSDGIITPSSGPPGPFAPPQFNYPVPLASTSSLYTGPTVQAALTYHPSTHPYPHVNVAPDLSTVGVDHNYGVSDYSYLFDDHGARNERPEDCDAVGEWEAFGLSPTPAAHGETFFTVSLHDVQAETPSGGSMSSSGLPGPSASQFDLPGLSASSSSHTRPPPPTTDTLIHYSSTHFPFDFSSTQGITSMGSADGNYEPMGYSSHDQPIGFYYGTGSLASEVPAEHHLTRQKAFPQIPPTHGGTFFTANNVNTAENIIQNHRHGETGIGILHHAVALDALHDSADGPQPRCHPETRREMLDGLYNWATSDGASQPIHWLHGPAGAGKSAIMWTLCQRLQEAGRLGGAFFFKRGHPTRGNARVLFATLAYQLALNNHELHSSISERVERDPSVVGRYMDVQLRQLVFEPCRSLRDCPPPILLVDGLDECDTHQAQVEILRMLGSIVQQHRTTFRFLIASRPEAYIRDIFEEPLFDGIHDSLNVEQSFKDVETYLRDEFGRVHREHKCTMGNIQTPWPPADILGELVSKSSGYFVYASTVIKFVDDKYFRPIDRLAAVMDLSQTDSDAPFAALDQLYIHILSGVPARFRSTLGDIFQYVTSPHAPKNLVPHGFDELLGLKPGDADLILRGLHSVVNVTEEYGIQMHHASFGDFLKDPQRSSTFHIKLENHMNVARAILKALSRESDTGFSLHLDSNVLAYVTSMPPSTEFVPLIRSFNPDFLFYFSEELVNGNITEFLSWLNAIPHVPEDLIRSWENYDFLHSWNSFYCKIFYTPNPRSHPLHALSSSALSVLRTRISRFSSVSLQDCHRLVVQSPEFVQIFQACWLLQNHFDCTPDTFYWTRLLLDVSWDSMVAAFSALSSIIPGGGPGKQALYTLATIFALPFDGNPSNLAGDLARSFLRLIRQASTGGLHLNVYSDLLNCHWGELIRASPHTSTELLQDLHDFIPPWEAFPLECPLLSCFHSVQFHNVLHWLKQLPDPPLALIARWESYLMRMEQLCRCRLQCKGTHESRRQKRVIRWDNFVLPSDDEAMVEWWESMMMDLERYL
ncbi:hypothetical protein K438DRAFT_1840332 [Mycena galopus ATCC 62051]|nr:hypothetical protein K438DRAFT_1840332 [Mycena galopus ATCC 62051]